VIILGGFEKDFWDQSFSSIGDFFLNNVVDFESAFP